MAEYDILLFEKIPPDVWATAGLKITPGICFVGPPVVYEHRALYMVRSSQLRWKSGEVGNEKSRGEKRQGEAYAS